MSNWDYPLDDLRTMRSEIAASIDARERARTALGDVDDTELIAKLDQRIAQLTDVDNAELPETWILIHADTFQPTRLGYDPFAGETDRVDKLRKMAVIAVIHVTADGTITLERP
jgi:hypothetical protein